MEALRYSYRHLVRFLGLRPYNLEHNMDHQELYEKVKPVLDKCGWPEGMYWESKYDIGFHLNYAYLDSAIPEQFAQAIIERHLLDKAWEKWPDAAICKDAIYAGMICETPLGEGSTLLDVLITALEEN